MERGLFSSFSIGSIVGIPIRVHVLLVVLIVFVAFQSSMGTVELVALLALFPILLLHELGHCLVARRFGIGVVDITLWPLGGLARMTQFPESGRAEAWIASAGPAVNLVLALSILPLAFVLGGLGAGPDALKIVWALVWINLSLAVFNLIPAFPTDGGRILRALLSLGSDWVTATRRAVIVGRVFALLIASVGIAYGVWTAPIVAFWLWWMGSIELAQVAERHRVSSQQVEEPPAAPVRLEDILREDGGEATDAPRRRTPLTDEEIERLERFRGRLRGYEN